MLQQPSRELMLQPPSRELMLQPPPPRGRKRLSLSIRISLWLIGVALTPLLLALLISELQARPTLVNQASLSLETNAQAQSNLIDEYLTNKLQIISSLDNIPLVQQYFENPKGDDPANIYGTSGIVQNGLALEKYLYPDVSVISFFTLQGNLLLSFSLYHLQPQMRGAHLVPPEYLQKILQGQPFISDVYYDPTTHTSSVDLYTPVYTPSLKGILGLARHTLRLDAIWNIVNGAKGANGSGSYAFLLDQNGVRIIDPNPHTLFTAIAPLSSQEQQQVSDQALYGLDTRNVPVIADQALQSMQSLSKPPTSFQEVPAEQQETFQVARSSLHVVPWTYFALTPVNVVETVANQQLLILSVIALLILIPVALIGWLVGRRISFPVLRAVEALRRNSSILNDLAGKEDIAASEQVWVVASSRSGLQSLEYYTRASESAIGRLNSLSKKLSQHTHTNTQVFLQDVETVMYIARYLDKAIDYQDESYKKVSAAIGLTNKIAKQLASGASSTKEAADQLNRVVRQLRQIVGRRQ
ncbi:MAG TPA: cache domain-containing protein [Ktedonobacteraceae bacterium]|nr:cache domain-containing protein [Ktedonobacteraceae bacterium]